MKLRTKVLGMMAGACLLVTATIFGTMAYLTDKENVTNTFTAGKVQIGFKELAVDDYGNPLTGEKAGDRVWNHYKILPGHSYIKNPTVTVAKGSEPAYIRVKVTFTHLTNILSAGLADPSKLLSNFGEGWKPYGDPVYPKGQDSVTYEYRYQTTVNALNHEVKLPAVFRYLDIPAELDAESVSALDKVQVLASAYAIQADGFASASDAWAKYDSLHK